MLGCSFVSPSAGRVGAIVGPSTMSGRNASDLIGQPSDRRKLIAVVYADMVGYSRLIGLDDAGTLERLRTLRRNLIDPAIEEHGGKVVQTGGDLLLMVFDSIDGAVRCAVKVQQQLPIVDGDQPECPPGGICVSRSVRDHVHGRLDLVFEELGALNLKNIARPVEFFVLKLDAATLSSPDRSFPPRNTSDHPPLPSKPSIAVLPFQNMSGDPEQMVPTYTATR